MRSRYTAFATGNARHLLATHQATAANFSDLQREQLQAEMQGQQWLALRIHNTERGGAQDETGVVEFTAYYRDTHSNTDKANIGQLHERSRFSHDNGCWLYVDGDSLPPTPLGRNDACWCGSSRKYKKCHLKMASN
ncbi:MAG: SEC-C motif-containing protein [Bermanella sp.]|jgi:SEC-C motif-containing protein